MKDGVKDAAGAEAFNKSGCFFFYVGQFLPSLLRLKTGVIHIKDHGPDIKDFERLADKGGIPDEPKF
jgi:hypothetical protein